MNPENEEDGGIQFPNWRQILKSQLSIEELNNWFQQNFNIRNFFPSQKKKEDFLQFLDENPMAWDNSIQNSVEINNYENKSIDLGDFQTPSKFAEDICQFLAKKIPTPTILLEPTCGQGNFVFAALKQFSSLRYIYCIELQSTYQWVFKSRLLNFLQHFNNRPIIEFYQDNIYTHTFSSDFLSTLNKHHDSLLILGNPPWVTNSALEGIGSTNLPLKSNYKKFSGIESITGKSNFDIAESIIVHLFRLFSQFKGNFAMLCKNIVVRNIVKQNPIEKFKISDLFAYNFDSKTIFNINANTSLFIATMNQNWAESCQISIFEPNFYNPAQVGCQKKIFGWVNGKFVSDIDTYKKVESLEGTFHLPWRQGMKHDLTKIMVLQKIGPSTFKNGYHEIITLEEEFLYPFLKSSDLQGELIKETRYYVIVPQNFVGEDTSKIQHNAPLLWNYINTYKLKFEARKSSIYKNRPSFSIFGIGEYSFAPYKIGISGFYKQLRFALIFPIDNKSVMLDDTCYMLAFQDIKDALITWAYLHNELVSSFFAAIMFFDSKRPITKEILMRLNFSQILTEISPAKIHQFYQEQLFDTTQIGLTIEDFELFSKIILQNEIK